MIESLIEKMKQNSLRPKEEISIKDIFKTINKSILLNKKSLNETLILESGHEIDFSLVQNIFIESTLNNYGNTSSPFINNYGRVSENMTPYGIVGLQVEKRVSLNNYLEIIKTCIETRNSLIIKPYIQSQTLTFFVKIINDVLSQAVDFNEIEIVDTDLTKENIDLFVYVGDKAIYKKLNFNREKIFLGLGQYELYVDEIIDEKMIEFARNNGIKIYHKEANVNVFDKINEEGGNYCTSIMSGNKEKIREFISQVKSSYVLVNMSPTLITNANLFPEQLLKRKTTIIFE